MSCAAHHIKDVAQLRAALEAERLRAERAEAKLEGFREAIALVVAARPLMAPPAEAPVAVAPIEPTPSAPRLASVTPSRSSVTASVTPASSEERTKVQNRERARVYRLRRRSVTASVTGVTASVMKEEEKKEVITPPPPPSRVTGVTASVTPARGSLTLVSTAARAARERPPPATPEMPAEVRALREGWNELCASKGFTPWPKRTSAQLLEDAQAALERRPLAEWLEVFARVPRSPVCRGELSSRRRVDLLWLLKGKCRDGYEPAEKLFSGSWQLDPEPRDAPAEGPAQPAPERPPAEDTPAARAWGEVLASLRADRRDYALQWLEKLRAREVRDGVLVLEAQDRFQRQWAAEHYGELLTRCVELQGLTGVCFSVAGEGEP